MQPVADQIIVFLMLVILGTMIGLLFDIYRVLRKAHSLKKWGTNLGDAIFWVLTTSITYWFLLKYLWGEVRVYVFISMLIGFILYRKFFSLLMRERIFNIHSFICGTLVGMVDMLKLPFKRLISILLIPMKLTTGLFHVLSKGILKMKSINRSIGKGVKRKIPFIK